ncbi:MAG TPA: UDP-N-acetylglucosamine 1-carboxyvinyltransferase [Armatimonadota bacterium]|nr:UDP-N-acetylglucosamine 1-carboxyvinyltransferase [Armatimonadota bacterium]
MSDCFRVVGGLPLHGEVILSGSKNGALPILAATLLVEDEVILHNVPQISDIDKMCQLISLLGAKVEQHGETVRVDATHITSVRADRDLAAAMRASFYVVGPLLARVNRAEVPLPGGCAIGSRPVDYVIKALKQLGATAEEQTDVVVCTTMNGLQGATVTLDPIYRSPGATFNVAMAAVLAKGRTIIENASSDPEIENFCRFLQAAGANIEGVGTNRLVIEGRDHLHGCEHTVVSDRIEAGTYLLAAAATRGEVRVSPCKPAHIESLLERLEEMGGIAVLRERDAVTVRYESRPLGTTVYTTPFPGFPTDLQPPMVVLMCLANGKSIMNEAIYDGRLNYVHELRRMGAQVKLETSQQAVIEGVESLQGRKLEGADMRAGAALVVAALAAEGESVIAGRHYIIRGYEHLEKKLSDLGARIIVPNDKEDKTQE